ncbi:MAG: glycosyltransferase family 2 protein [Myxococcota bacterium]
MKLSIIIAAYREEATVGEVLRRVLALDLSALSVEIEVLLCDDGSDDGTRDVALAVARTDARLRVIGLPRRSGKSAAIRRALMDATGDYTLIQDADLEYDPADYPRLLEPVVRRGAAIVYGSRFLDRRWPEGMRLPNWIVNRLLAWLANLLYGSAITDEATCFKLFRTDLLRSFRLECQRFAFCPEVTAKAGLAGIRIVEAPVRYRARRHGAGKKIRLTDGIEAIWTLLRFRLRRGAR